MSLNAQRSSNGKHFEQVGERRLQIWVSLAQLLQIFFSKEFLRIFREQLLDGDLLAFVLFEEFVILKDFLLRYVV